MKVKNRLIKSTWILFVALFLLQSCSTKDSNNGIYYIINHTSIAEIPRNDSIPPVPPLPFYGNYNFILLDSSRIFFHSKEKHYNCGYGLDCSKPFHIFLSAEDLKEIKSENLEQFLKLIPDSVISGRQFYPTISSPVDTIRNSAYKTIDDFFKSKNIRVYIKRNWTEEEHYVLDAKLKNMPFDYNTADWKIGFGDTPHISPPDSL